MRIARRAPNVRTGCMIGGCMIGWLLVGCEPLPPDAAGDPGESRSLEDDFVLDPASADRVGRFEQAVTSGDGPNGAHVLFLNFDGATITKASDNPALNRSFIPNGSTTVIPSFDDTRFAQVYTRADAINKVVDYANGFYANYNVMIVTTRPASGRYTMMMVGGTATLVGSGGSVVGIAPLDCGNQTEGNVGFAFAASLITSNRTTKSSADTALRELALTIVHEAGHSYGLEHVNNQADIMYPSVSTGQTGFLGVSTVSQTPRSCGSGTTQDTAGTLASNLGTRQGPLPDLGGAPADLASGAKDLGGSGKDSGGFTAGADLGGQGEADLGDPNLPGDHVTPDPPGGGRAGQGGCSLMGGSATLPPAFALLGLTLLGLVLRRRL